jgi:NTE family protein
MWKLRPSLALVLALALAGLLSAPAAAQAVRVVVDGSPVAFDQPPVTIGGRRYMDGGVRSGTSADLAQRIEPDIVLILAPMGRRGGGVDRLAAKQVAREKGELEAAGASVRLVHFDDATKDIVGMNLMDPTRVPEVLEAGLAHGRRLAGEIRAWWRKGR